MYKILKYMTPNPIFAMESDSILHCARLLEDNHIRHLPIVNENNCPVGIISDRDILNAKIATDMINEIEENHGDLKAGDIMRRMMFVALENDSLGEAAAMMIKNKVGGVPVIDSLLNNRLTGVLSYIDILEVFSKVELLTSSNKIEASSTDGAVGADDFFNPLFEESLITSWQKRLGVKFPQEYIDMLLKAEKPIDTLNYCVPYIEEKDQKYIVFSHWNESNFAFEVENLKKGNSVIYIIQSDANAEKKFNSIEEWKTTIAKAYKSAYFGG